MSDLGEYWKDVKDYRQEKRWSNYAYGKKVLEEKRIPFTEKPNGHFIILDLSNQPIFDFWATTGLFIHRKTKKKNRSIHHLIQEWERVK